MNNSTLRNATENGRNSTGFGGGNGSLRRLPDDDLGPMTKLSLWVLASTALLFLLMRIYCKIERHRRLHADDYFAIAAWVRWLEEGLR